MPPARGHLHKRALPALTFENCSRTLSARRSYFIAKLLFQLEVCADEPGSVQSFYARIACLPLH